MKSVTRPAVEFASVVILVVGLVGLAQVPSATEFDYRTAGSRIVAARIEISHDFAECAIQFANEGNLTDTTRSVLLFYVMAGTGVMVVRNANPSPTLTIPPGGTVEWDCTASFAASPPGVKGDAVHAVVSAVMSRERDSAGTFT